MRKWVIHFLIFLLIQIRFNLSPISQLVFQICAFLVITIQCAHCAAMGERKDISSISAFQRNSNRVIRAFNECIVILNT